VTRLGVVFFQRSTHGKIRREGYGRVIHMPRQFDRTLKSQRGLRRLMAPIEMNLPLIFLAVSSPSQAPCCIAEQCSTPGEEPTASRETEVRSMV
jgi:hypothetical protein